MNHLLKLIDAVFLTRPLLLVPVWGFGGFGYYQGKASHGKTRIVDFLSFASFDAFAWLVLFSLSVAAVHVLNQIADLDVDRENGGLPLLARGKVSMRAAWICAGGCVLIGIAAPALHSPAVSVLACGAVVLGYVYSFKPLRFSGRPFFDFLANASGYGIIAFGAGWNLSGAAFSTAPFVSAFLPYFLLMCAGSISSTIPDYAGDMRYGKKTTAVFLGVVKAHTLATAFLCSAMVVAFLTRRPIPLACALCAFPFYLLYFFRRDARVAEATYKVGGACCMIFAAVVMPAAGIAAVAVAAGTTFYFRKRHRIVYPSLVPVPHEQ